MREIKETLLRRRIITKSNCWEWTGAVDSHGYGNIFYQGMTQKVSRVSFKVFRNDPGKLFVCHSCYNPPCFNPDHLFSGTSKDNQLDSVKKCRHHYDNHPGELNGNALLTDEIVRKLRKEYSPYIMTIKMLSTRYKVSIGCVTKAIHGQSWKHVDAAGK